MIFTLVLDVIAIYKSLNSEVDTNSLIEYSLNNKKIVLLPKVVGSDIKFFKYDLGDLLIKSNFGVLEPVEDYNKYYEKEKIDLVIVPGISFSRDGSRLGFGKGYYDRFLSESNIETIGICFKEQISDVVPTDENDYKLDIVISD